MGIVGTGVEQVPLLSEAQVAQFKRDGYLVLPAALDPDRCRATRDAMWETIGDYLPRMKRADPSTWGLITDEENAALLARVPDGSGDPFFGGKGHRFFVRNGAEEAMLNLAPRPMWGIAEQLLGRDTIVPATGLQAGTTTGPCFMSDDAVTGLASHLGDTLNQPEKGSFTTETLQLPATGPVWLTGQGTRGLYCTLPGSPSPGPDLKSAHSDGACYGRWRLQMAAYTDDLPANSGGFTVWPGSHIRVWEEQWKAFLEDGERHTDKHLEVRRAGGYTDPVIQQIKADTQPVDCHGPAGTVVLWHTKILHMAGQNCSADILRQATIYGFMKTPESIPDARVIDDTNLDVWRDWSAQVRDAN